MMTPNMIGTSALQFMMLTIGMLHLQQYCLIRWHYEFLYIKEGLRMLQTLIVRIPIETIALDTQTAFVLKHDSVIYTEDCPQLLFTT